MKCILSGAVGLLPKATQNGIRDRYWRFKSEVLYKRLYEILNLQYQLQSGINVRVASMGEWWTYNDIFVNYEYDAAIQSGIAVHNAGRPFVVLDLGANVGYFSLRVADLMLRNQETPIECELTLVEGSPKTFRDLQLRLGSQVRSQFKHRLVLGLVGQRQGQGVIRESAIHVKNTIMQPAGSDGTRVDFVDIDSLMAEHAEIDLLKCDIEGAEMSFIENYPDLLRKVKIAVFELHHGLCDAARCLQALSDLGFRQTELRSNEEVSICLFSKRSESRPKAGDEII